MLAEDAGWTCESATIAALARGQAGHPAPYRSKTEDEILADSLHRTATSRMTK